MRKAVGGVFAPFISEKPILVDQRCNSLVPIEGILWEELAAVVTSSLFAYSLEVNGGASMGAGALEAPTTKLRTYPAFDVRQLTAKQRERLVVLAKAVWDAETPIDWTKGARPGAALSDLDEWLLSAGGAKLPLKRMYDDFADTAQARVLVADDKVRTTKKKQTDNIGNVADSIVASIKPKLSLRNFPDDFLSRDGLDIAVNVDRESITGIKIVPLLGDQEVEVTGRNGTILYSATHASSVVEAIVRALLWGRSIFSLTSDSKRMQRAVDDFLAWALELERDVDQALRESALGTGYEDTLRVEVYRRLGISPVAAMKALPTRITW